MTDRKPAGITFESWVERQLRQARESGSFDNLPGTGKPLPRTTDDALAWVREKARREDLPMSALLPPSLAVAKDVEELPSRLARERSEGRVRAVVKDLNARIDAARRSPQVGPPVRTRLLDMEAVLAAWRAARPTSGQAPPSAVPAPGTSAGPASRPRRWFAGPQRGWFRTGGSAGSRARQG